MKLDPLGRFPIRFVFDAEAYALHGLARGLDDGTIASGYIQAIPADAPLPPGCVECVVTGPSVVSKEAMERIEQATERVSDLLEHTSCTAEDIA